MHFFYLCDIHVLACGAEALKKYPRESYILQTKGAPKVVVAEFVANLEKSFKELQLGEGGYLDLFSFHGVNRPEHLEWIFSAGGCWEVVEEYRKQGKIRFVGFSSHGHSDVITQAIEVSPPPHHHPPPPVPSSPFTHFSTF